MIKFSSINAACAVSDSVNLTKRVEQVQFMDNGLSIAILSAPFISHALLYSLMFFYACFALQTSDV